MGDRVSWYTIESVWQVSALDGTAVGEVVEVLADEELDIFSGLVVGLGSGRLRRYAAVDLVRDIERGEITLSLGAEEVPRLPIWTG